MRFAFTTTVAFSLLTPFAASATGVQVIMEGQAITFVDVPQNAWFAGHVQAAAAAGIVNGYKDTQGHFTGKFGPSNSITIAEALKIAVEGAGYDPALYGTTVDSGLRDHWASGYIAVAQAEGFAVLPDRVRIDRPATRAEVAALFTSAFDVDVTDVTPVDSRYGDVKASTRYAASIEALSRDMIVSGDTNTEGEVTGTFRPLDDINRAEVVKMIMGARTKYGQPGEGKRPQQASSQAPNELVSYTDTGFAPAVLRIKKGTAVSFKNESGEDLWVASNPHPTHTGYVSFDTEAGLGQGETYIFTFTKLGSFGYHNHLHPSMTGTMVVEE